MTSFEMKPDGHGVILSGELDMANAADFQAALKDLLPVGGPVSVEMRELRFMDSSGIQAIIAAARAAPDTCIILHGVHDQVDMAVEVTGIDARLPNLHVMPCTVGVR
jgi:anti-anti-sigma factor